MSRLLRLPETGRTTVTTVRAGWDDDATNDQRITLFDARREGLDPRRRFLPKGVVDGFVSADARAHQRLDPHVEALSAQAKKNQARRMLDIQGSMPGVPVSALKQFTDAVRDAATFQVRMSPQSLLGFIADGRFKTAFEVPVHHDDEPVTPAYTTLRAQKEATTGLEGVVYASVTWNEVSRDTTSPYGPVVLLLRNDRIFDRVSITERETFAYVTDREGFANDVATWNELGPLVTHFVHDNDEPAGNFERTGSAPHIEAQIHGAVTPDDVDAVLLPAGEEYDAVAAQVQAALDAKGISRELVEVVRYEPEVPEAFDRTSWR